MPRSVISKEAREAINEMVVANIQQAIYPSLTSSFTVMRAEATQKFIAVPPVLYPSASNHLLLPGGPSGVELYRDDEYYFAFNSTVTSQSGAWVPGGVIKLIPLNPGMQGSTLAVVAVVNTSLLRVNWIQS